MYEENVKVEKEPMDEDTKIGIIGLVGAAIVGSMIGYGFGRAKGTRETMRLFAGRK